MNPEELVAQQKIFFESQKTKNLNFRKMQLERLEEIITQNEKKLSEAVAADFGRSAFETYALEMSFVLKDLSYFRKNLKSLAKPKRTATNLANMFGTSAIYPEPLGNVLVIGTWNYPIQLTLSPAIAALAAGNTCLIKPSEIAPHTMACLAEIINNNFAADYFHVVQGGVPETTALLENRFDQIFFTGSTKVGKIVYEAAARHLTPVVLELGGKSPAVVTDAANLDVAAKRIVWGKFINAGQTCVAPDYILVDEKIKDSLLDRLKFYIEKFNYQSGAEHYAQIINARNFERLLGLIPKEKIFYGGKSDAAARFIQPTVLTDISWEDAVMQEEIFGPVLPVLTFNNFNEALRQIASHEKPLAAYLFSDKAAEKKAFLQRISFGGGCINDVMMHLSNERLPFGGVGNSGMGAYHGKYGFETFSHAKSIVDRATWGEPDLKYPPYTAKKKHWLKKLL